MKPLNSRRLPDRNLALTMAMLSAMALLASCQSGITDPADDGEEEVAAPCKDLKMAATAGLPLDRIRLENVPSTFTEPLAMMVSKNADSPKTPAYVSVGEDGYHYVHLPLHPDGAEGGAAIAVLMGGNGASCQALSITIQPLPAAPAGKKMVDVVGKLEALLDHVLSTEGLSRDELTLEDLPTMDPSQWLLLMTSQALNPEDPNSLQQVLAKTSPVTQGSEFNLDLLDRLVHHIGFPDMLDQTLTGLRGVAPTFSAAGLTLPTPASLSLPAPASLAPPTPARPRSPSSFAPSQRNVRQDANTCIETTASELNDMMNRSRTARNLTNSQGQAGKVLEKYGYAIAVIGLVPGAGVPATALGGALFAFQKLGEYLENMNPSAFTKASIESLTPFPYYEDEDLPLTWDRFMIEAKSNGWTLDQNILEAMLQLAMGFGLKNKWAETYFDAGLQSSLFDYLTMLGLGESIKALDPNNTTGIVKIPPRCWMADATDEAFSETVSSPDWRKLDHRTFEPLQIGAGWIEAETRLGLFGNKQIEAKRELIIDPIEVVVAPPETRVTPGETIDLAIDVHKAKYGSIVAEAAFEQLSPRRVQEQPGRTSYVLLYDTPPEASDYPVVVRARSTSTTGLRAGAQDQRTGSAMIFCDSEECQQFYVSPGNACLTPGETTTFTVQSSGGSTAPDVTWSAESGTITQEGVYTAPSSTGSDVVTATSIEYPDRTAMASVTISENCDCTFTVSSTAGEIPFYATGSKITYQHQVLSTPAGNMEAEYWYFFSEADGMSITKQYPFAGVADTTYIIRNVPDTDHPTYADYGRVQIASWQTHLPPTVQIAGSYESDMTGRVTGEVVSALSAPWHGLTEGGKLIYGTMDIHFTMKPDYVGLNVQGLPGTGIFFKVDAQCGMDE